MPILEELYDSRLDNTEGARTESPLLFPQQIIGQLTLYVKTALLKPKEANDIP